LSLPLTKHLAGEIVLALEYMHNNGIIHRDLKPGNVVLDKKFHSKLIDFATCKVLNPKILDEIAKAQNRMAKLF
jgi:serine/threonine protein kinase